MASSTDFRSGSSMSMDIAGSSSLVMPIPEKTREFNPDVFHQYEENEDGMSLFVPKDIVEMLRKEATGDGADSYLRDYFKTIPQHKKPGPDGATQLYSSGPLLTEDLLVGYFDEITNPVTREKKDVIHFVLIWSDKEQGWVMPGKLDRAYDLRNPDISVEDANLGLVTKEIGAGRDQAWHHSVLGYFDDRKREGRFKSSGFLSFVLLDKKPQLEPGKRIGLPFNALIQLARREISLPLHPTADEKYLMARNHDSLILQVVKTAKFYHTMGKIKLVQAKFREMLRENPHALRPAVMQTDPELACPICFELFVGTKQCFEGHSICGVCLPLINSCPTCRTSLEGKTVRNLSVDAIAQTNYPEEYEKRCRELGDGEGIRPLLGQETFLGTHIQYV